MGLYCSFRMGGCGVRVGGAGGVGRECPEWSGCSKWTFLSMFYYLGPYNG